MVPAAWVFSCRGTPWHPREMDRRPSLLQLLCSSLQWRHRLQHSGVTAHNLSQREACLMLTWRNYEIGAARDQTGCPDHKECAICKTVDGFDIAKP